MGVLRVEQDTYTELWSAVDRYGENSPGELFLPVFLDCIKTHDKAPQPLGAPHILDAGTGSGKGALALQKAGFRVTLCDVTDAGLVTDAKLLPFRPACLWHSLRGVAPAGAFDWVYCTDVLEHIEPAFTMLAVEQMLRVAKRGVFLSVSLVHDNFGAFVGRHLHRTVQSYTWWRDALKELGRVCDARDMHEVATFYVVNR